MVLQVLISSGVINRYYNGILMLVGINVILGGEPESGDGVSRPAGSGPWALWLWAPIQPRCLPSIPACPKVWP